MNKIFFSEIRLIISNSTKRNDNIPYLKLKLDINLISKRINLIKTLKAYIKKYCNNAHNKNNILYLSILYLDIILSKYKISLSYDKNLKYLCLCCFLLSLKFIGNYDISKKIIKNFCNNYREEYKIFEMQCLYLLDYNLIYTTSYDYLTMILIKGQKILLKICSSILYQICEDNLFLCYSPFYISVAIIQIAKVSINDKSYNHYDKYFHDQRVKYLYKMFNYLVNIKQYKNPIQIFNNYYNGYDKYDKNNSQNYKNILENKDSYLCQNRNSYSPNINIFTNNNIQNNIIIINYFSVNKNDKNDDNEIGENDSSGKAYIINKKIAPNKIYMSRKSNTEVNKNILNKIKKSKKYNNDIYEYFQSEKTKIQILDKNQFLSNSSLNNIDIKYNSINNNYNLTKMKEKKNNQMSKEFSYYPKASNNFPNFFSNNSYNRNTYNIKKIIKNKNKTKDVNIMDDIFFQNQNINNTDIKNMILIQKNRSSLNFQIVSGVSKDKLVKLTRNLSKNLVKPSYENKKNNNN